MNHDHASSGFRQCKVLLREHHPSLEVSLDTIKVSTNRLDWVHAVGKKVKFYSKAVGPVA